MRKRILALISATAIVALAFGATPRTAAATTYDFYINNNAPGDNALLAANTSCKFPYSEELQDALDDYTDDDTIYLCAGTYGGPFYAENGDVTIVGAGAKKSIIDGHDDGDPAISVGNSCETFCADDLTIDSLTITNGSANECDLTCGYGGGVFADNFTCSNSVLSDNYAGLDGGAVYAQTNVTINKCTFTGNRADEGSGGAVYVYDTIIDNGGVYRDNAAGSDGGAVEIYGPDDGDSYFTKSTFDSNYTCYNECKGVRSNGGAIHIDHDSDHDLTITSSKFIDNWTDDWGGAVFAADRLYITSSSFINNYSDSDGGAVYSQGNMSLVKDSFKYNGTWCEGGALYTRDRLTMESTTFLKNYSIHCSTNGGWADSAQLSKGNSNTIGWTYSKSSNDWSRWTGHDSQFIYVLDWVIL